MRKTTLLIGVVAGVAVALLAVLGSGGGTASADNGPHVVESGATPDKCAACHRIHTGQNDFLLKEAGTVEDFCYSCHGTAGAGSNLSVQNGTFYGDHSRSAPSSSVGLRAGGFEQARINTTDPTGPYQGGPTPLPVAAIGVLATPQTVNSRHLIDGTTAGTMWGGGAIGSAGVGPSFALECTSCHDPHGNGNYRILRSSPAGTALGTPTPVPYAIPDTYPKGLTDYTVSNYFFMSMGLFTPGGPTPTPIPAGTPVPGQSILVDTSRWCAQCHTRYLARSGRTVAPASEASRANSGDAIYTFRHTSAGWGISSSTGLSSFNNRACITCHATHGSNASMPGGASGTTYSSTVPWPGGNLTPTPIPGDAARASMLKMDNRGMCRKCHSTVQ